MRTVRTRVQENDALRFFEAFSLRGGFLRLTSKPQRARRISKVPSIFGTGGLKTRITV